MRLICSSLAALTVLVSGAPPASASVVFVPPVDAPIVVRFDGPEHRFGPGHRGVDYAAPPGTRVRAAAAGTVSFAGHVAGRLAVTVSHAWGYETTYSALAEVSVKKGEDVSEGTWIGRTGSAHAGGIEGLHFGVKEHGSYVDPESVLGVFDVSEAIHLAPLVWQPPPAMPVAFRSGFADAGTHEALCRTSLPLNHVPATPPNDNIALAVAGISSQTDGALRADMYEHGPEELGYEHDRIYHFSYAGPGGERLHTPYRGTDTYGDIAAAARRLRDQLVEIKRLHPEAEVDLIAHSMGGLVVRRFLATVAKDERAALPRIEHLVTFASPHRGASLASLPAQLKAKTLTGDLVVAAASRWSRAGVPLPDPSSIAMAQLAPDSRFLRELERESMVFGTKALALGIPNDAVVTADRTMWDEAESRVVAPEGWQGHAAIVASDAAQGLAYDFLRGAPSSCKGGWDLWGPRIGRGVGLVEEQSYRAVAAAERTALGRIFRVGKLAIDAATSPWGRAAAPPAGTTVGRLIQPSGVDRF